jgi:hypothetical protein
MQATDAESIPSLEQAVERSRQFEAIERRRAFLEQQAFWAAYKAVMSARNWMAFVHRDPLLEARISGDLDDSMKAFAAVFAVDAERRALQANSNGGAA